MQTRGRGRRGRTWSSPAGGLWLSIAVPRAPRPKTQLPLTIPAAIACARAIEEATGVVLQLKWPNDLYVADRKLGGLLVDVEDHAYVIGVGLNVSVDLDALPAELRKRATSVAASGPNSRAGRLPPTPEALAVPVARALFAAFVRWERGEVGGVLEEAWSRSILKGREVIVEPPGDRERFRATVIGLGDRGELLVRRTPASAPEALLSASVRLR